MFSGAASSSTGGVGGGVAGRPPFSLGSQPLFGQSPQFGQHSLFGGMGGAVRRALSHLSLSLSLSPSPSATGGSGLSGGPPPFSFRGGFAGAASRCVHVCACIWHFMKDCLSSGWKTFHLELLLAKRVGGWQGTKAMASALVLEAQALPPAHCRRTIMCFLMELGSFSCTGLGLHFQAGGSEMYCL